MVSNASEDFPEPDNPVSTTSRSRGRSRSMFFKLWVRAPRMRIFCMQPITIRPASRGDHARARRAEVAVGRGSAGPEFCPEFLDERAAISGLWGRRRRVQYVHSTRGAHGARRQQGDFGGEE